MASSITSTDSTEPSRDLTTEQCALQTGACSPVIGEAAENPAGNAPGLLAPDSLAPALSLSPTLRLALGNGELKVVYQPQINLATGKITGVEALVQLPRQATAALDEESGLVGEPGMQVLERACHDLANCQIAGMEKMSISISLSPLQCRHPQLAEQVAALLAHYRIDAALLWIDVTEAALTPEATATLTQLQRMGIGLGLDDFGTSMSSLKCLEQAPFRKVKIDQSLIEDLVDNPDHAAIVRTIISMSHSQGLLVAAGGVGSEAQCQFLRDNLCDEIQGSLFSRPVSAEAFAALVMAGTSMPAHPPLPQKTPRTLLIVDDEVNIVSALKRLLRRDGYQILTAHSGAEGLDILKDNAVDVILSDQRMPGMTGVEFLSIAKNRFATTVRLVLSGFTELQSVTDAVNEGAVYKFLTKPWDDTKLRGHIQEAFHRKELADENRLLTRQLYTINLELAAVNQAQKKLLNQKKEQIARDTNSLLIVREAMRHVPMPVIAIDDSNMIAFVNDAAASVLHGRGLLLGGDASRLLPEIVLPARTILQDMLETPSPHCPVTLDGQCFVPGMHAMGSGSQSRGWLVTLTATLTAANTGEVPSSTGHPRPAQRVPQ